MVNLVLVRSGNKYSKWYEHNIVHMLKDNLDYEELIVIEDGEGSVYDKLKMFKLCNDDENYLYFDLDIIIKGSVCHLVRDKFTLLHAWWRREFHTPLNSSIMSWKGDHSHIYDKFYKDEDYNRIKYHRGIDEYIFKEIEYQTYEKVCWSWSWHRKKLDYPVCLFNHDTTNEMHVYEEYLLDGRGGEIVSQLPST